MIGFYNREEKCLLRGKNWVYKRSSLRFVFKGLNVGNVRNPHAYLFIDKNKTLIINNVDMYHLSFPLYETQLANSA